MTQLVDTPAGYDETKDPAMKVTRPQTVMFITRIPRPDSRYETAVQSSLPFGSNLDTDVHSGGVCSIGKHRHEEHETSCPCWRTPKRNFQGPGKVEMDGEYGII